MVFGFCEGYIRLEMSHLVLLHFWFVMWVPLRPLRGSCKVLLCLSLAFDHKPVSSVSTFTFVNLIHSTVHFLCALVSGPLATATACCTH